MVLCRTLSGLQIMSVLCIVSVLILVPACSRPPEPTPTPRPEPSPTPTLVPPELEIVSPTPEAEITLGSGEKILASGTHNLSPEDHVWIFLKDIYGGYYLQNPHVELLGDGTWEAPNIRPRKEIRYIICFCQSKRYPFDNRKVTHFGKSV